MTDLLSREEAAQRLGVSVKTIDRLRKAGRLRSHHIGARVLITVRSVESLLASTREKGRAA